MSLLTDLISVWKLGEASGDALDSHGSNDLTETSGTIGTATGKIGNARDFEAGDTEYFSIADNADLSIGNIDFTATCWVKRESAATYQVVGKWVSAPTEAEWRLVHLSNLFRFYVSASAGTEVTVTDTGTTISDGVWYFVVMWHDASANTINLCVNNGTVYTTSHSGGVRDSTAPFLIGSNDGGGGSPLYFDGLINYVSFWKRVLTSDERTLLYNGGYGLPYEYYGTADPSALLDDLEAYWPLDEASGDALDAHGSLDLTETGGTIAADTGKVAGCRDFEAGDTEHFEIADNAALSGGDTDFTIAGWVKFETLGDFWIAGKWKDTGNQREYAIAYSSGTSRFTFFSSSAGSAASISTATANNFGAPTTGVWYFVVVKHDSTNNLISIQVNLGVPNTAAAASGVFDGTAKFMLGQVETGVDAGTLFFDGMLDEWGFWRRLLTDAELVALYNEGDGLDYASFGSSTPSGLAIPIAMYHYQHNLAS